MKYIIGTKVGMMQVFDVKGRQLAATIVHCEPNKVLEVKTIGDKHSHNGTKIGYLSVDEKRAQSAHKGIFRKVNSDVKRHIREFPNMDARNVGDEIKVDIFQKGEYVDVQGTTKGHGFTGAIKRWNFKIGPLSHGAGFPHRYQGSVAMGRGGSQAQRVPKGKKMSGHYGHETVTVQNLIVLDTIPNKNLILILGAIPGPKGSVITIKTSVKNPGKIADYQIVTKEIKEEILKQNEILEDKEALHAANVEAEKAEEIAAKEAAAKEAREAAAKEAGKK